MRLSDRREVDHDAAFWDRRARHFRGGDEASPYVAGFIAHMRIRPGESVLDVGCGSGALALPLAREGHDVVGLDFSAGMLDVLRRQASEERLTNVRTVQAAWDDDWRAAGVGVADVVIASRSLDVRDLRAALQKLDAFARRRVCVTLPADGLLVSAAPCARGGRTPSQEARRPGDGGERAAPDGDRGRGRVSRARERQPVREPGGRAGVPAPHDRPGRRARRGRAGALRGRASRRDDRSTTAGLEWKQEPEITVRWAFLAWDKPLGAGKA